MRARKSIPHCISIRARWALRRLARTPAGRRIRDLKKAPRRTLRWWNIYRLRLSWGRFFIECGSIICLLALSALSYLFISHFLFGTVQVQGPSMYPTLINGNFYWLERFAYVLHDPKPGDIVAIKDPGGHGFDVKRIIAVPRQSIYLRHGKVYVDGRLLEEPYLPVKVPTFAYDRNESEFWCLAPGQYFVMGDNRGDSCDSRSFGAISNALILGRIIR